MSLAGYYHEDAHLLLRVTSVSMDECTATVQALDDRLVDLFVLLAKDKELYRVLIAIGPVVERDSAED